MNHALSSRFTLPVVANGLLALGVVVGAPRIAASDEATASNPTTAPAAVNTTAPACDAAFGAIVKLYGRGIGREHGYGTGFLISSDGQIVTTQSLLVASRSIRAVTADGRTYDATHIRSDETRKLALLKIDAMDMPHLALASSEGLLPGDSVIAFGNWFKVAEGEEQVSVSRGILSLRTYLDARRLTQDFDYRGPVLVIDAVTANPGAPGGPLMDIEGRCIGIIGIIVEAAATNTRLNYALPSEEITAFLENESKGAASQPDIEEPAKADPYLGIRISKLGFRHVSAYIERVVPGSPAAAAGLKKDDLIVALDGKRIADVEAYDAALAELRVGQRVTIIVKRGADLVGVELIVGEKP